MGKIRYEKVKFHDGDDTRTVFLRVTKDSGRVLAGVEVDKDGEDIEPPGFSHRIRVIDKQFIVWRRDYVMDNHYATLVPKKAVHR